jgi:hypothetical protein
LTIRALLVTVSVIAIVAIPTMAMAEQRALLVGVGKYSAPGNDLPAIDLDIERMSDTLLVMGFDKSQIRTLQDEQATADNVIEGIGGWLTEGVEPADRVVFYFSGHGSNIPDVDGDESDGVDEVLVTHDVRRVVVDGRPTLNGVVPDDVMNQLLSAIPSRKILTIIDSCHSGTSTRSFNLDDKSLASDPVFAKSFMYDGMPQPVYSRGVDIASVDKTTDLNYVSISAADDDEKAIGTSKGGVFTIGFSNAITEAAKSGEPISLMQLRDKATAYIESKLSGSRIHHPQVTGNKGLAEGDWEILQLMEGNGPNRDRLIGMVEDTMIEPRNALFLEAGQLRYFIDEPVRFNIEIPPEGGYLNVVTVDSEDTATVLFPNQFHTDNQVEGGEFVFPSDNMSFELPASEPLGPTIVAAFVTQDPINFYEQALEGRDADGNITVAFTTMSQMATRAIRIAPKRKEMYAGYFEIFVTD